MGSEALIERLERFHVRVNGGEERVIKTRGTIYCHAVAAVPALLGIEIEDFPLVVDIWVPRLVEAGYGPYCYYITDQSEDFAVISVNSFVAAAYIGAALQSFISRAVPDGETQS